MPDGIALLSATFEPEPFELGSQDLNPIFEDQNLACWPVTPLPSGS